MRDRRMLILWSVLVGIVAIAAVLMFFPKGGEEQAQAQPAPTTVTPEPESTVAEDGVTANTPAPPDVSQDRSAAIRITAASQRDPVAPVATPTPAAKDSQKSSSQKTSSSNPVPKPTTRTKSSIADKPAATGSQTGASETKKSKSDDSGSKAPVPICGGVWKEGETTGITIVDVGEVSAIVRINNLRTTLYLNVPDASGVTFVSSLGGGCGWFAASGAEDRLTICEGDTRQL